MKIEITECQTCPFYELVEPYEWGYCNLMNDEAEPEIDGDGYIAAKCPLKGGSVTVCPNSTATKEKDKTLDTFRS